MPQTECQKPSPIRHDFGGWATLARSHAGGAVLPRHQHSRAQLVFGLSGVMLVETDESRWTVPPQRALWIPPQHPHTVQMLSATEMRTVYCRPELIARSDPGRRLTEVHAAEVSPLIRELVLGLFDLRFDHATREAMVTLLLRTLQVGSECGAGSRRLTGEQSNNEQARHRPHGGSSLGVLRHGLQRVGVPRVAVTPVLRAPIIQPELLAHLSRTRHFGAALGTLVQLLPAAGRRLARLVGHFRLPDDRPQLFIWTSGS